jgi:chromosome segregation ATPase
MYKNYLNVYNELKEKSEIVSKNRQETLKEIDARKDMWRKVLHRFLKDIDETYRQFLTSIDATGMVRTVNLDDVETAGLELSVGFKGLNPTILDAYTQSGGERTSAIMAFLLALQKYVKSPVRAVDEFDVHMDPKNREAISNLISSTVKGDDKAQYIVITPGQLPIVDEKAHIIMVQNVEGRSETRTVT